MQKYLLIGFLFVSIRLYGQNDALQTVVSLGFDTTWNHTIEDADLILKLKVVETWYITFGADFSAEVLEVAKGKFSKKKISWSMGMMEDSQERWDKRYAAIYPKDWKKPYIVYAGFKKSVAKDIESDGQGYQFFMSAKEMNYERMNR